MLNVVAGHSSSIPFVITIDGPSGSGKGTIALLLARHYGFHLLDSGALYRLIGLAAYNAGLLQDASVSDQSGQDPDAQALYTLATQAHIRFEVQPKHTRIMLNGQDVTSAIRSEEVGALASRVAVVPQVRQALLQRQRDFAQMPGLVADGRDMGTVIFPDAQAKIYLTASAQARAERRARQLQDLGENVKIAAILADLQARDARDMQRPLAPLKPSADALVVDSSNLTIDQVVRCLIDYIDGKRQHQR